ncbi:MAG: helix-turn-helix transcriptional regulator [Pyrinomonadaceae bacterium]
MFSPAAEEENHHSYAIVLLAPNARVSEWTLDALRAGVRAVLPTMATENEILAAIEAAAAGLVVLQTQDLDALLLTISPSLDDASAAAEELAPRSSSSGRALHATTVEALTPREAEILGMLGEGLGNKTIAYRLGISDHTVKFHVASIFGKLGVSEPDRRP